MSDIEIPWNLLENRAREVIRHSWSPYSNFPVAAVLLTSKGELIHGVNIENRSYGLTTCAERSALSAAVSRGYRRFHALLVLGEGTSVLAPCGACRQLLVEFSTNLPIRLCGKHDPVDTDLATLLPLGNAGLMEL